MAGVADGVRQAVDGAVGQVAVVQILGVDVVLVDVVPCLADEGEPVDAGSRRSSCGGACGGLIDGDNPTDPDTDTERQSEGQDGDHALDGAGPPARRCPPGVERVGSWPRCVSRLGRGEGICRARRFERLGRIGSGWVGGRIGSVRVGHEGPELRKQANRAVRGSSDTTARCEDDAPRLHEGLRTDEGSFARLSPSMLLPPAFSGQGQAQDTVSRRDAPYRVVGRAWPTTRGTTTAALIGPNALPNRRFAGGSSIAKDRRRRARSS